MIKTKTLEMGGIYREAFIEYFLEIGGKTEDQETMQGYYWGVLVGPETWKMLGSIRIPQVLITFNVEEDKFDDFLAKFRSNFLRGGG